MKKTILIVLLSVLLLSAMAVPAMAQDMTVGVSVDDWFKYEARVTLWESEEEFLWDGYMGPLSLADNETTSIVYTVTDITPVAGGNNVTFTITYNWRNGSVTEGESVTPVSTAVGSLYTILTGANLEPGDLAIDTFLFMGWTEIPPQYINETIMVEYPDVSRETNVLEYSAPEMFGSFYDYKTHFDKETGIRVYYENHGEVGFGTPYNYTLVWQLVESNVWIVIPEFPTGTAMLLVFIAITVSIDLYRRKKLKH